MARAKATSDEHHQDGDVTQESHLIANAESSDSDTRTSDEADKAFAALYEIFSSPSVRSYLSCCTDGPTEFDLLFESLLDECFGFNPNSKYKRWIRRLRRHGLIPPSSNCDWTAKSTRKVRRS